MKKFISLILVITLLVSCGLLTGCDKETTMSDDEIRQSLNSEYENIKKHLENKSDYASAAKYVVDWAKDNDVTVREKKDTYLVLSLPATEGYEHAQTATLQMSLNFYDLDKQAQALSLLLTTIKAADYHGKTDIVFTKTEDHDFIGAKNLKEKYIDKDNFISFMYASQPALYNKGAAAAYTTMTRRYVSKNPDYTKAYRLEISGLKGGSIDTIGEADIPNPIVTLGNFLASAKSKGLFFEISSFNGGSSADTFPQKASAVIVVPEGEEERLLSRFESSQENFSDNYLETEPDLSYTLTPVRLPSSVLSDEDTDDIINLIYTLDADISRDKNGVITSATNLGTVSMKNSTFRAEICAQHTDKGDLLDIQTDFETACGLCDISCSTKEYNDPWITYSESPLVSTLSELLQLDPTGTIAETENVIFKDRKGNLNLVAFGCNVGSGTQAVKAMTEFLSGLDEAKEIVTD